MPDWIVSLWLPGEPPRKSNSRMVVRNRRTGKPMVIKSPEARAWIERALLTIPPEDRRELGSADRPLWIEFDCYYETRRPDLSIELVMDALERADVISNDRHVYRLTARKHFSKDKPGVWVKVGYLEERRRRVAEDGHACGFSP